MNPGHPRRCQSSGGGAVETETLRCESGTEACALLTVVEVVSAAAAAAAEGEALRGTLVVLA